MVTPTPTPLRDVGTIISSCRFEGDVLISMRNGAWTAIYPLDVTVSYVNTRYKIPMLALTTGVSLPNKTPPPTREEYVTKSYSTVNLLENLTDDPSFIRNEDFSLPSTRIPPDIRRQSFGLSSPNAQNDTDTTAQDTLARSFRRVLPVKTTLDVRMRTTTISPLENALMMSVEVENNPDTGCPFVIQSIQVDIVNGLVEQVPIHHSLPIILGSVDQMTFLYNVTLLEELGQEPTPPLSAVTPRIAAGDVPTYHPSLATEPHRFVSITIHGAPQLDGVLGPSLESKWNCNLDLAQIGASKHDPKHEAIIGTPPPGKRPSAINRTVLGVAPLPKINSPLSSPSTWRHSTPATSITPSVPSFHKTSDLPTPFSHKRAQSTSTALGSGIIVTFSLPNEQSVTRGSLFTLDVMIINKSRHLRNFELLLPHKRRIAHASSRSIEGLRRVPTHRAIMDDQEFVKRHGDMDADEAALVCLENNIRVGSLPPMSCQNLQLCLVGLQTGLHTLEHVQLRDEDTGFITNLRNVLGIWVR